MSRARAVREWLIVCCALLIVGCAGGPAIEYASAPPESMPGADPDAGEAQALEQAEADCARQGKHAVSQRVEGETLYSCAD
jgi:hypothetical protein